MGLGLLTLAALATLTIAPTVQFTTDSKYTSNKILTVEVETEEITDEEKTEKYAIKNLVFTENYVLGYTIYDDPSTPYIDGLKVDDTYVTDWRINNYDDSIAHTIHVKTVYTDDIAGALAAASKGDFSKVLANPIMILQFLYFSVALIAVIVSLVATVRTRIKKNLQEGVYQDKALALAEKLVSPFIKAMQKQQDTMLKAAILGRSNDPADHVKMIELLESSATTSISDLTDNVKKSIIDSANEAKLIKEKAHNTINQIAEGTYVANKAATNLGNAVKDSIEEIKKIGDDGTSI